MGKSTPADWGLLHDESAPVADRASVLSHLCADGHMVKLLGVAEAWLTHREPLLRHEGLKVLLLRHGSVAHLPHAFRALHDDPKWWVRDGAADLLVGDWILGPQTGDEIVRHLVQQLEVDEDEDAQMGIYEALLKALIPRRADRPKLPSDADKWDRARDVDWALLAPWASAS